MILWTKTLTVNNLPPNTHKTITPANRQEWLGHKAKGIGASEIASVLNINRYQTPYDLWLLKTKKVLPPEENKYMKSGKMLEGVVVKYFEEETGLDIIPGYEEDIVFVHPEKEFIRVTPDRLVQHPDGIRNLEAKTTMFKIDPESMPPTWFVQMQYQAGCIGTDWGYLAWLSSGVDFDFHAIEADPEYFAYLADKAERFWIDNVLADIPPDPVNADDVQAMFNKHSESMYVLADEEYVKLVAKLDEAKKAQNQWKAHEAKIKDQLALILLDAEGMVYNDEVILTYKTQAGKSQIDRIALEDDHPEIFDKYYKKGNPYRVMRVKNV